MYNPTVVQVLATNNAQLKPGFIFIQTPDGCFTPDLPETYQCYRRGAFGHFAKLNSDPDHALGWDAATFREYMEA